MKSVEKRTEYSKKLFLSTFRISNHFFKGTFSFWDMGQNVEGIFQEKMALFSLVYPPFLDAMTMKLLSELLLDKI